jgi:hypothetical protein
MNISILCITKLEGYAQPYLTQFEKLAKALKGELVIGFDVYPNQTSTAPIKTCASLVQIIPVRSEGYLESVHDLVVAQCRGDYVLRLDDDEQCSPAMEDWLKLGKYRDHDHWKFNRAHLWPTDGPKPMMIKTPQLWPDQQTRLSVRAKADGRNIIHAGSPYGGGELAPVLIEHHKFLVKTLAERRAIVANYDRVAQGAGTEFAAFSVPEDYYKGESHKLIPLNDGRIDTGHYEQGCGGCGKWITL